MDGARRRTAAWGAALLAAAVATLWASDLPAPMVTSYKNARVAVTAVRGSRDGEESVSSDLGELGEQIRKKYNLKRVETIGTVTIDPKSEDAKGFSEIGSGLKMKIGWRAIMNGVANFKVTVAHGDAKLIESDQAIKLGAMGVATAKTGKDLLIVLLSPTADVAN